MYLSIERERESERERAVPERLDGVCMRYSQISSYTHIYLHNVNIQLYKMHKCN